MSGPSPVTVLFIAGHGRCGSTLLDVLLGSQDPFVSVGELSFIWTRGYANNELCGCGAPFRECGFWRGVLQRALGSTAPPLDHLLQLQHRMERTRYIPSHLLWGGRARVQPPPESGAAAETYADILTRLYRAIQQESGKRVVVDSSKYPRTLFLLRRVRGIRCCVVHLVRDSRASAYSWQRRRARPEVQGEAAYMDRYSVAGASAHWIVNNTLTELARGFGGDYLQVRYEDLVASPAVVLARICGMVGVAPPTIVGRALRLDGAAHTAAGNPMRLQRGMIALRPDEEWRSAMRPWSRRLVTGASWPWLLHYGYRLRASPR